VNSNKKSITVRGVTPSINRQAGLGQFKPVVAQLKTDISAQSKKRPVAPPVYCPKTTANAAQAKMASGVVNRKLPVTPPVFRPQVPKVLQTKSAQNRQAGQASHYPVAPPLYRPEAKKIVQPKAISPQAKIANSIRPITPKRTAFPFSAVQMAEAKKGRKECFATVVAKGGGEYPGAYKSNIHAEINALESYLSSGGTIGNVKTINLSSSPCKYCHLILSDLGVAGKVVTDDERDFGSCSGGSFGWFDPDGSVWKAIKKATGYKEVNAYIDSVIERQREL